MESSIVDLENTEFPSVKSPEITCLSAATKHAKWGQLNNSRFKFIYLFQIFKHTTCKYKWLGDTKRPHDQSQLPPYLQFTIT